MKKILVFLLKMGECGVIIDGWIFFVGSQHVGGVVQHVGGVVNTWHHSGQHVGGVLDTWQLLSQHVRGVL